MADLLREFWIRETGTGQQVAQLHDRYTIIKNVNICNKYQIVMAIALSLVRIEPSKLLLLVTV